MKRLYPVQERAVSFMEEAVGRYNAALNSSDVGTGKTLMTLELLKRLKRPGFVVCPLIMVPGWQAAAEGQGVELLSVINYEKLRTGRTPWARKAPAARGNPAFTLALPDDAVCVWDEVHYCKSYKSQNSALLTAAVEARKTNIQLSATPFRDPTEMRSIGYALRLHNGHDYWRWAMRNGCYFNERQKLVFDHEDPAARACLETLKETLYSTRAVRLLRSELGEHFSRCTVDCTPLDFGKEQRKIAALLESVQDELEKLTRAKSGDGPTPEAATKLLRARQEIELLKVPTMVELVRDYMEAGFSCFVALNFNQSVDLMLKLLTEPIGGDPPVPCCVIRGGQSPKARQEAVEAFAKNLVRVCVCNGQAGGVGVSLHDTDGRYPRIALINPNYDEKQFLQLLGRVDRVGSKSDVLQRVVVAARTVETKVMDAVLQKVATLSLTHGTISAMSGATATKDPDMTTDDAPAYTAPEVAAPEPATVHPEVAAMPKGTLASDDDDVKPALGLEITEAPANQDVLGLPDHHEFGPSGVKHIMDCPGFWQKPSTNAAAELGTRVHAALELDDNTQLESQYEQMLAERTREVENKLLAKYAKHLGGAATRHREIKLVMHLGADEWNFGTCDRAYISKDGTFALVVDYKSGREGVAPPEQSWQAKLYVLGVFQQVKTVQNIHFWFILPARNEVSFGKFDRSQTKQIAVEAGEGVARARMVRKLRAAGKDVSGHLSIKMSTCRFCSVPETAHGCELWSRIGVDVARKYQPTFDIHDRFVHGSTVDDPEVAGFLFAIGKILSKAIDGWEHRVKQLIFERGEQVPNVRVVQKRGKRQVVSQQIAYDVAAQFGATAAEFIAASGTISVSSWEAIIGSKAGPRQKSKLTKEALVKLFEAGGIRQAEDTMELRIDPDALAKFAVPGQAVAGPSMA